MHELEPDFLPQLEQKGESVATIAAIIFAGMIASGKVPIDLQLVRKDIRKSVSFARALIEEASGE